jgi:hypothetical protein
VVDPRISAAPAPPLFLQNLVSSDNLSLFCLLTNVLRSLYPPDLLERGVRQYILNDMRASPVSGWIQRCERSNEQYLELQLVGLPHILQAIEDNLLNSVPRYWTWSSNVGVLRLLSGISNSRSVKILDMQSKD